MIIYKHRKKTNEELFEGWMRSDSTSTKQVAIAIILNTVCYLTKEYNVHTN